MSPPIGSGNRSGRKDTKTQGQRLLLRKIAAISATSGLFLNLIAILSVAHVRGWHSAKVSTAWAFLPLGASLIWDLAHLVFDSRGEHSAVPQRSGDALAFLGFVAILVANGVVAVRIHPGHANKTMLMAYNSFPWIICATMHLRLATYPLLTNFTLAKLPKIKLEWPEASPMPLVEAEEYYEDVESQTSKKDSSDHQGDDEEGEPLLSSS